MRVLLTNHDLATRGGTQVYVRDLATELLRRGHTPIVYSLTHGDVARELRSRTVPVVSDLDDVPPPDLIHGQEHLGTMTALLRYPRVPAIFFCHSFFGWGSAPPRFPRIVRYVAVDEACRDRLVLEHGIPEERVRTLLNYVDLGRFRARDPLPSAPRRAVLFSNYRMKPPEAEVLRGVCAETGLTLDVIGEAGGGTASSPEDLLGGYDLVFAKGRSALEALAVGAAVVVCGVERMGPLVTAAEFERLRGLNFGVRTLQEPISAEALRREIRRYDARDAAEVARRTRLAAGAAAAHDETIELYEEVIAEHAAAPHDADGEARAAASYLRRLQVELDTHTAASIRIQKRLLKLPVIGRPVHRLLRRVAGRVRPRSEF